MTDHDHERAVAMFGECPTCAARPPLDRPRVEVGRDHPDTAKLAAASVLDRSGSDRQRVYEHVRDHGGATDDEIEQALNLPHQTASARRRGLVIDGYLVDSGERRDTRTGRAAIVWTTA